MMEIEYRPIDISDFDEVKYFFITHEYSWRDADPENFIPRSDEEREQIAKKYIIELQDPKEKYHCLGAFLHNKLIGSHFLDRYIIEGKSACHVHGLWVDPSFREKGVAHKLKELGETWARSKGCLLMDSNVKVSNKAMISLNERMGYKVARYNFRKEL